jgi:hypothetical protein
MSFATARPTSGIGRKAFSGIVNDSEELPLSKGFLSDGLPQSVRKAILAAA